MQTAITYCLCQPPTWIILLRCVIDRWPYRGRISDPTELHAPLYLTAKSDSCSSALPPRKFDIKVIFKIISLLAKNVHFAAECDCWIVPYTTFYKRKVILFHPSLLLKYFNVLIVWVPPTHGHGFVFIIPKRRNIVLRISRRDDFYFISICSKCELHICNISL